MIYINKVGEEISEQQWTEYQMDNNYWCVGHTIIRKYVREIEILGAWHGTPDEPYRLAVSINGDTIRYPINSERQMKLYFELFKTDEQFLKGFVLNAELMIREKKNFGLNLSEDELKTLSENEQYIRSLVV